MCIRFISTLIFSLWLSTGFANDNNKDEGAPSTAYKAFDQHNDAQLLEEIELIESQLKTLEKDGNITSQTAAIGYIVLANR